MAEFKRQRREYAEFFHNGLKNVELRGCVCPKNTIELASIFFFIFISSPSTFNNKNPRKILEENEENLTFLN